MALSRFVAVLFLTLVAACAVSRSATNGQDAGDDAPTSGGSGGSGGTTSGGSGSSSGSCPGTWTTCLPSAAACSGTPTCPFTGGCDLPTLLPGWCSTLETHRLYRCGDDLVLGWNGVEYGQQLAFDSSGALIASLYIDSCEACSCVGPSSFRFPDVEKSCEPVTACADAGTVDRATRD